MQLGKIQELTIDHISNIGAYLADEEKNTVLLPKKELDIKDKEGTKLKVFLYKDSRGRLIATKRKPFITLGQISMLKVNDISENGAYLSMGLERDLFLPYAEIRGEIKKGDKVKVYMYIDKSDRLCSTMFTNKHADAFENKTYVTKKKEYEYNIERVYVLIKSKFDGLLPYNDKKVNPETVEKDFGISKSAFKSAIGGLYKEHRIEILEDSIKIIK